MDFGLGLVLSFTDNATAGINNAVNTLNQLTQTAERASTSLDQMASLSALSVVSGQIGNSFTSMGHNIISTLGQVIGKVNETGKTLMYAEKQLDALYANSGKTGQDVVNQIQKYAKESMFDFENLIPAVISLKSVGIEAFDAITSSTGEAKYSLLDYASGLASFAPQMKNAYGTGVNAAIGAMREYIAEGNAMSLKRGAGLDITGILGEDKGATIEERTRQVADLIEQLNMMGMVDAMKDSPMVKLSNMGDVLFQLKGMISDSEIGGLSNSINSIIDVFYNFVTAIDESRLETIAKNVGSALSSIMKPVEWLSKKIVALAEGFVSLVENNPALVKFITVGTAIAGVLLVLAGVALKFTSAFSGVSLMILASGNSFKQIGGLFKTGALKMLGVLLPLTATLGLLYLAWKNDFAGIKTNVTSFVSNLGASFKTARESVNGSVSDLMMDVYRLESKNDFFSNLTLGLMRVMMFGKALSDAWGDYELSEDNFLKAKELGILPLIEAILDFKYRFENFAQGFVDGWKQINEKIGQEITNLMNNVEGTPLEGLFNSIGEFLKMLAGGDAKSWYDFGKSFGSVLPIILAVVGAFKLFNGIINVFTKFFGFITSTFGGVAISLGGVILAVTNFIDMFENGFNKVKAVLTVVGGAIAGLGLVLAGIATWPAILVGAIVGALGVLVVVIKDNWTAIKDFFISVGTSIADFFVGLWEKLEYGFGVIADTITSVLKSAVNGVLSFVGGIINGVIDGINSAIDIINAIPGVNIPIIPTLNIPQLAKGGIVSSPTTALIGEAGTEAVVPLENNTGWLSKIANMLVDEISEVRPSKTISRTPSNQGGHSYLTNNNTTNTTQGNTTQNSVVIQNGAIQINVQKATDEEANRLAKKILEYIKRQQELDRMTSYA